jgi:hypothetical protein
MMNLRHQGPTVDSAMFAWSWLAVAEILGWIAFKLLKTVTFSLYSDSVE